MSAETASGVLFNKAELAQALGCSLPTLDKLLRRHAERFPVVRQGRNGVEWQFDPEAVIAFLQAEDDARARAGQAKDELMQQVMLPGIAKPEDAGLKPADLLTMAKVRAMEREERIQAGFLVQTADVRAALTTAFTKLRTDMFSSIRTACSDANIPQATIRTIISRVEDADRRTVAQLQHLLDPSEHPANDGDATLFPA